MNTDDEERLTGQNSKRDVQTPIVIGSGDVCVAYVFHVDLQDSSIN